jgi:hypothetical protein
MNAILPLAWHVTKKDLRALRDLTIMWVLATLAQTLLRTVWPPLSMTLAVDDTRWVEALRSALPFMRMLLFALIVAKLVHADPLVSTDAFWLTRPIARPVLFVSKLLTISLVLAVPAVLGQVAPMIAYGVPPLDLMRLLSENALYFNAGVMAVFAAAALTPNLRSLTVWAVGLFLLLAGAAILMSGPPAERRSPDGRMTTIETRPIRPPAPGLVLTSLVLITAGCGFAAWHQYRTRSRERSALIAAVTAGAALAIPSLFAGVALEAHRPALTDAPAVALDGGVHFKDGARSVVMWAAGDRHDLCTVMVRVTQSQAIQSPVAGPKPMPSSRFVHRQTGKHLVFTYFALPDRAREMASGHAFGTSENFELFQVFYRYVLVGPMFAPGDREAGNAELKSVSCRDVDVVVQH